MPGDSSSPPRVGSKRAAATPVTGRGRCPVCRAPTAQPYRPFCSARCRDVDLSRWLSGTYAIPGGEAGDEDGDDSAARRTPAERDDDGDGSAS